MGWCLWDSTLLKGCPAPAAVVTALGWTSHTHHRRVHPHPLQSPRSMGAETWTGPQAAPSAPQRGGEASLAVSRCLAVLCSAAACPRVVNGEQEDEEFGLNPPNRAAAAVTGSPSGTTSRCSGPLPLHTALPHSFPCLFPSPSISSPHSPVIAWYPQGSDPTEPRAAPEQRVQHLK